MSIYFDKIRKRWRFDFELRGKRYGGYCCDLKTGVPAEGKLEARAIETKLKAAILENNPIRPVLPGTTTVAEAFAAYVEQVKGGRSWETQRLYVRELLAFFGENTPIAEVTEKRVWDYISWSRKKKIKVWYGGSAKPALRLKPEKDLWHTTGKYRSDSSINRYLDALRKALNIMAKQRDPVSGQFLLVAPPKLPKLREPDALPRPISAQDLEKILARAPEHLADAIKLCCLMGFRKKEVVSLTVDHVDLDNRGVWLKGEETKGKRGEFIPANREAVELLERLVDQAKRRGLQHLISFKHGKKGAWRRIKGFDSSWYHVLEQCGLKGRHKFHNTKATFVTAVAMKAPAPVAQQLARHRDFETTRRYIRISDEMTRKAVDALDFGFKSKKLLKSPTQESHTKVSLLLPYMDKPLSILVGATGFEPATPSPPD